MTRTPLSRRTTTVLALTGGALLAGTMTASAVMAPGTPHRT